MPDNNFKIQSEGFGQPINLTMVIPCYNESDRINLLYTGLEKFIGNWNNFLEIIIVNDGSKDNTEKLLKEHAVYLKHINIISIISQNNTGKGGALRNGVLRARGNYILTLDADMASPPTELLKWLNQLKGRPAIDTIYIGSREHKDSVITKAGDRKVVGNIFNYLVRLLTPLKMRDTQCGFKFYPAGECKRIFESLKTYGWAHDVELLYKATLDRTNIVEMPLEWNAIQGSKIRLLRDGTAMFIELIGIIIKTKLSYKPIKAK